MNVITIVGTSAMVDLTLGQQALIDTEDMTYAKAKYLERRAFLDSQHISQTDTLQ